MTTKILSFALCVFPFFSANAQGFPLDFTKNPAKPLVFERPDNRNPVLLFYPGKLTFNKNTPCDIVELSADSLQVTRRHTSGIEADDRKDEKLRRLFNCSRPDGGYFAVEHDDHCKVYHFGWDQQELTRTDMVAAGEHEKIVLGVSDGTDAYIVGYEAIKKKDDHFNVYALEQDGHLHKHKFIIPPSHKEIFDIAFKKSGGFNLIGDYDLDKPLAVRYDMEQSPEEAARRTKIFASQNQLWLLIDKADQNNVPYTRVYTFDLDKDTMLFKVYRWKEFGQDTKVASYIYENKLFQVGTANSQMGLCIRDMFTSAVLNSHYINKEQDSLTLVNSPVYLPGKGSLGIEREYSKPKKFLRRYSDFSPSIQVRAMGDDYLLCLGGYEEINTGGGARPGMPGMPGGGGVVFSGGNVYTHSCAFYTALNRKNLFQSSKQFDRTLTAALSNWDNVLDGKSDETVLYLNGHYYFGAFGNSSNQYRLSLVHGF